MRTALIILLLASPAQAGGLLEKGHAPKTHTARHTAGPRLKALEARVKVHDELFRAYAAILAEHTQRQKQHEGRLNRADPREQSSTVGK
jgi:hypothetical protein